ncbi:amidohydrolase [Candidatus Kryptonium thompsonii]|nr:amidohydrolase [Candidatus Kryptonium thompsoni]
MPKADLIFINGKIWTVDKAKPVAQAVAVLGDKIIAVGSNSEIKKYAGKNTKVVDLKKKLMLPGFIDDHTHFVSGGFQLMSVDLRTAKTPEEFALKIKEYAEKNPGRWITGGDWDHELWGGELPRKEWIDKYTQNVPVFVTRYDGHMGLANSLALKLAGITRETPDPPGGLIVRDENGEPTGILKDEAMSLVYKVIPEPSLEERISAIKLALEEAKKLGLTGVHDIGTVEDFKAYQELYKRGELTIRVFLRLPISQWEDLAKLGIQVPFGNEFIRIGSLKAYADGSLGSMTALFFDPYDENPNTKGLATDIVIDGRLEKWAIEADKAKLQLSIHAIGDSANSLVLSIFEKVVKQNPTWDRRFRIEHAQHIHPKDFVRFKNLNVIASMQPYHAIDDGRWAEKRIGKERCKTSYAFRTFLDNGVKLCFGSDWNVAPLSPILGIYAAVARQTLDGKHPEGWFPEQKISVEEAVECYTINNAYAEFAENEKGSITPGKLADFVVLSDDIFNIPAERIKDVKVLMTVLGGKIIYQSQDF